MRGLRGSKLTAQSAVTAANVIGDGKIMQEGSLSEAETRLRGFVDSVLPVRQAGSARPLLDMHQLASQLGLEYQVFVRALRALAATGAVKALIHEGGGIELHPA